MNDVSRLYHVMRIYVKQINTVMRIDNLLQLDDVTRIDDVTQLNDVTRIDDVTQLNDIMWINDHVNGWWYAQSDDIMQINVFIIG